MGFINNLKDKQKDQSAKNWFDLGVQTKSLDKKVQYFTKCLLIEPENVQALRLLADAQDELGMIDAAMGSRARADDIEGAAGAFSQEPESYTESNSFDSNSFNSNTMFAEEENQEIGSSFMEDTTFSTPENNATMGFETPASEPEANIESSDANNEKWAIFEIAKENEAKKSEDSFSTSSGSYSQPETNVIVEELNEVEEQLASTPAQPETPVRAKPEPTVVRKPAEEKAPAPVREQPAAKPVSERPVSRPAPTPAPSASRSAAVPQATPQCTISEPVAMKLPMGEIIKFWVVGAVVLIIVGMIMNSLAV
ncbi:hypothetical protein [Methanococcoides sp. LMO-2]|uniref:Tetratricopeptide repeat protein n=1 Tax=Methanococcoides cohabitans TaxID=3136559 RepID=A0ABU9KPM3_9EURY